MKNIYSNIFKFNKKNHVKSIISLEKNNVIGLPTETVYGLAGNAYSLKAVKKIYKLKKRPSFNPLIIHYYSLKDAKKDIEVNNSLLQLYKKFCPGPITFVLKKRKSTKINKLTSLKLNTVAIRFPSNLIIRKILKKLNFPLAIPSGNISSGISPISAQDVAEEFKKKLNFIIDGGVSKIGIESTVVDLSSKIKILRPGIISSKEISKVLKKKVKNVKQHRSIKAPGALKFHYSPGIPIKMNAKNSSKNHAFIIFGKRYKNTKNSFNLSKKSNLNEAAKNLYKIFRKIKKLKYKKINVVKIPNKKVGVAINDRIKKASGTK
tara:strand:+ start:1222 stop:2181 length:960 start_codon:yes stop_codon:yes gene_type:complete